jgi:hypothetical protein
MSEEAPPPHPPLGEPTQPSYTVTSTQGEERLRESHVPTQGPYYPAQFSFIISPRAGGC